VIQLPFFVVLLGAAFGPPAFEEGRGLAPHAAFAAHTAFETGPRPCSVFLPYAVDKYRSDRQSFRTPFLMAEERGLAPARHPIDWQYGCQTEGSREGSRRKAGVIGRVLGLKGFRRSFMPASSSVRLPLRSLHP
jgi:hypothetical protein